MVNVRRTTDDGRRSTDDGRRTTDDGRRTTDDGRRTTDDGRRTTDDGRRTTDDDYVNGNDGNETDGNEHNNDDDDINNINDEDDSDNDDTDGKEKDDNNNDDDDDDYLTHINVEHAVTPQFVFCCHTGPVSVTFDNQGQSPGVPGFTNLSPSVQLGRPDGGSLPVVPTVGFAVSAPTSESGDSDASQ